MTTTPRRRLPKPTSSTQRQNKTEGAIPPLSFDPNSHTYWYGDESVMSVTQILKHVFPAKYRGVPAEYLERAAERGNIIHGLIETYAINQTDDARYDMLLEGINYDLIESKHDIIVTSVEQMLLYKEDGKPLYAGTYDLMGTMQNQTCIIDIKTTSKLDDDYLRWQLSMYAMAYKQMYGKPIERLGAVWYPKTGAGSFKEYYRYNEEVILEEVRKIVEEYHAKGKE